jgi:uncharacterized membrane protein
MIYMHIDHMLEVLIKMIIVLLIVIGLGYSLRNMFLWRVHAFVKNIRNK